MRKLIRWWPGAVVVLALMVLHACGGSRGTTMQSTSNTDPAVALASRDPALIAIARSQQRVADSASQSPRSAAECREPLTGLMGRKGDGSWVVPWDRINGHISAITFEADLGERNHILHPVIVRGADTAKADIASAAGTEKMNESQSLHALKCGRVIARITATADHDELHFKRGLNYLVISRTDPPENINSAWIFVIINPEANHRYSLDKFTYTPHVTGYESPVFVGQGRLVRETAQRDMIRPRFAGESPRVAARSSVTGNHLSAKADNCRARGFKACFIDQLHVEQARPAGSSGLRALLRRFRSHSVSQPWVPCPLFGCCCGGDACHDAT